MSTEMYVELRCRRGSQEGIRFSFLHPSLMPLPSPFRIGRRPDAHLRFSDESEAMVSRSHAELSLVDGGLRLTDLGSVYGTWLGSPLEQVGQVDLPPGSCVDVQFGTGGPLCSLSVGIAVPFGRYLLTGKLGEGGMGEVYVAWDPQLARAVVLKLIRPSFKEQVSAASSYLLDEARILSQQEHPNTVRIYEVSEESGILYIAMEYLRGVTLGQILRAHEQHGGRLPHQVAAGLMRYALLGLHAAHELPSAIVHRDISRGNVMVTRDGLKVIDFGLARAKNRTSPSFTEGGRLAGNPPYMSPEQIRNPKSLDRRTDIYSASVLLYELCSGVKPFARESLTATLTAVLTEEPPPLCEICPEVSRELSDVLQRGMAKAPEERPATALDLSVTLRQEAGSHFVHFENIVAYLQQVGVDLGGQPPEPLAREPLLIAQARARPEKAKVVSIEPRLSLEGLLARPIAQGRYTVRSEGLLAADRTLSESAWQREFLADRLPNGAEGARKVRLTLIGGTGRAYGLADRDAISCFQTIASRRNCDEADGLPPILEQGFAWPDGPCFVSIPYYERRLSDVAPGVLSVTAVREVVRQAAQALHCAQQREPGLVHGSLRPDAVCLVQHAEDPNHVVLLGWPWLPQIEEGLPVATAGTAPYRAPELSTEQRLTAAADVFSLGMIAYRQLGGDEEAAWQQIHDEQDPPELPARVHAELPPEVERVLFDMIRHEPAMRPSALDVAQILARSTASPADESERLVLELPLTEPKLELRTPVSLVRITALDLQPFDLREPITLPFDLSGLQEGLRTPLQLMVTEQLCELRVAPEVLQGGRGIRLYTEPASTSARNSLIIPMTAAGTTLYVGHHRGALRPCSLYSQSALTQGAGGLQIPVLNLSLVVRAHGSAARLITLHWMDTQRGLAHLLCITLRRW